MLPANPLLNATAPAGPHLPVALLRQYAAGTLAPAAQHRVEAHTLACARCADVLAGLMQTPATTTDQALAQLQLRLRQRVQQQAAPARLVRETRRHRWLVPQLAAAAALLFGLLAGGWWTWQQRQHSPAAQLPVAVSTQPTAPAATTAVAPQAATNESVPNASAAASVAVARPAARPKPTAMTRPAQRPLATLSNKDVAATKPTPIAERLGETAPDLIVSSAAIPAAPVARAAAAAPTDSVALAGRVNGLALRKSALDNAAKVRATAMPAAPGLPPTPVGGYAAWREQLRREATEFKPEAPDQPLSGTVQLGVTIGADGKIQEMRVLHGLRADYDAEAQRLVCDGPKWVPGISGGQRAPRMVMVAVPF
ncbi:energy transducer TonB [Hymenobacter sp. H14-R3]|uniref:energy transducer TonB n=1 Tax=Hymenobacter sp. H14-R3 TaxID=3046308 RepID=UPI0024BADEE5|nr:energy transducer TonB [Hymenobacter sp. H14-R3]MDJ0366292.1 energy transducer TonB [Hymenobacter sp. H14-R3]